MNSGKPKKKSQIILTNSEDAWDEDFAFYPEDGASFMSANASLFHPQAQSSVTYRMK